MTAEQTKKLGAFRSLARAMRSWRTAVRGAPVVLLGAPARPRLVLDSRLDALDRRGHPRRRAVHAGAGAVGVQGRLVAADGPLRAAVLGPAARVDGASRRSRSPCSASCSRAWAAAPTPSGSSAPWRSPSPSRPPRRTSRSTPTPSRCCTRRSRARPLARASRSTAPPWSSRAAPPSRLASRLGWPAVNVLLALVYVPMLVLTWKAPEPEEQTPAPKTLRDAVWHPFLGFLARHRALEILAFVLLYKLADQLTQALTRPFLIDMGYNADHRGIALATVGMVATIVGAFVGGLGHDARRTRPLAVGLRLPADLLEHRLLPDRPSRRTEPSR